VSKTHTDDVKWMRQALRLAAKGKGRTSPNPCVGCLILKNGVVLGKGYHRQAGHPHAEIVALNHCEKGTARGATCYVTLEPCNHHGLTPPCAEAIIKAGIIRVVIGIRDPNPIVTGDGIARLRSAGIDVVCDVLKEDAYRLNEEWFKWISTGMPFVTLKMASSLDGKVATSCGESKWITSEQSRKHAHGIRTFNAAIMVGRGTVEADNPVLTARSGKKIVATPCRIVLDTGLRTPLESKLYNRSLPGKTLVVVGPGADDAARVVLEKRGIEVMECPVTKTGLDLRYLFKTLGGSGIDSILSEGGPRVAFSLLQADLVDKVFLYFAPLFIGGRNARSSVEGSGFPHLKNVPRLHSYKIKRIGVDMVLEGYVQNDRSI
jgi:diaminohydroxyphosphoribosylaminopyrimidine deaminase / 5-amino-6-(5-phosphoribosylamino)uracil reductase